MCSSGDIFRCGVMGTLIVLFSSYYIFYEEVVSTTISVKPVTTATTILTTMSTTIRIFETTTEAVGECDQHYRNKGKGLHMCFVSRTSRGKGRGKFTNNDVPLCLCSHLIYGHFEPTKNGSLSGINEKRNPKVKKNKIEEFITLRNDRNPLIKVLLSVKVTEALLKDYDDLRLNYMASIIGTLEKYELDGLDVAVFAGVSNKTEYQDTIVTIYKDVRRIFSKKRQEYILTTSVHPMTVMSTTVGDYNKYVDFFRIKAVRPHTHNEDHIGVTAIYYHDFNDFQLDDMLEDFVISGAPRHKVLVEIGLLARNSLMTEEDKHAPGDPLNLKGVPKGPYMGDRHWWSYMEVCETLLNNSHHWAVLEILNNFVYAYYSKQKQIINFESTRTAYAKGRYIAKKEFAGLWFSPHYDDFKGYCKVLKCKWCGDYKFPLMHAAMRGYNSFNVYDEKTKL